MIAQAPVKEMISPEIFVGLHDTIQHDFKLQNANWIVYVVCNYYKISPLKISEKTNKREIVKARQIAMYFLDKYTKMSLAAIGEKLGGKNHSTVIYGIQTVEDLIYSDKDFKQQIAEIENDLKII
jgi:chromosomal replication initiator protein